MTLKNVFTSLSDIFILLMRTELHAENVASAAEHLIFDFVLPKFETVLQLRHRTACLHIESVLPNVNNLIRFLNIKII